MKKLKVVTIIGTRPEIIRLSCVIRKFNQFFDHVLVHTGQNYDYELNEVFFTDLQIKKPDYYLDAAGETASETIGNIIISIDKLLEELRPDAVMVLGDTNSCLSVIPAKRRKIPIFHMEAGNRCFDQRVPEEINRRIVDHTADINLTYSSIAREYLLSEGVHPSGIIKTGSPMLEVLNFYNEKINSSNILQELNLSKEKFILVSAHREENIESNVNFNKLVKVLNSIAKLYEMPVVVSTHPRTQKRIDESDCIFHENVNLIKPLSFSNYVKLQLDSFVVLSDSGTINEESSILNFPALNIREAHERPEAMEEASVMMVGLNEELIFQALKVLSEQTRGKERLLNLVSDYSNNNVSDKVVRIVLSHIDFVNRVVWNKHENPL
jgi:UDP-N-acetyl-L-fucosamine synthase